VREADTSSSLRATGYGGPPGYGSGSYGGQDAVYQLRFDSPIQRCQSFRLRISDLHQSGSGRSFSLTEMKARVAVDKQKPNLPKRKIR
jgi:hypothetical protein